MHPTISIRLGDVDGSVAMRFSAKCERQVVEEARGRSYSGDDTAYDAAHRAFPSSGLVRQDVHTYDGAVHVAVLYRKRPNAYVLHFFSTSAAFPHERHDLDEVNAQIYIRECRESHDPEWMMQRLWDLQREALTGRETYSIADLAERWRCSVAMVRRLIRLGKLEAFRPGDKRFLVRAETVKAYEDSRRPEVIAAEQRATREARKSGLDAHRMKRRAAAIGAARGAKSQGT